MGYVICPTLATSNRGWIVAIRRILVRTVRTVREWWFLTRWALDALVDRRVVLLLLLRRRRIVTLLLLLRWGRIVIAMRVIGRVLFSLVRPAVPSVFLGRVHVTAFVV